MGAFSTSTPHAGRYNSAPMPSTSSLAAAHVHPLRRLFGYARGYRRDMALATVYSVLNKFFDVLPELLIGIAVDVVVNRKDSFIARLGLPDPKEQLLLLTALTIAIWLGESLFEYLY